MTPEESAPDKELLDRYRRASDAEAIAPSDATRAAILAEARRVAQQRATEAPRPALDTSRPAANDSRWKIPVFGTAGAALLAALLFAPRYWQSAPTARVSSAPAAAPAVNAPAANAPAAQTEAKSTASDAAAAPDSRDSTSPQETVVTQATRESDEASAGAVAKLSKPSVAAPKMESIGSLESRQTQSGAPQNYAQATPPAIKSPAAGLPAAPGVTPAPSVGSLSAITVGAARARNALSPATLQSSAALGDVTQTTALLDQGVAIDTRDELGRTPLMLAVMQDRPAVVRLLLARGADPNAADNTGHTPLQQAKQENLRDIAAQLERAGAR